MVDDEDRYIEFDEVSRITGYSRAHIDRLERDPQYMGDDPFPVRFLYGGRCLWLEREVRGWKSRRLRRATPRLSPVK